MAATVVFVLSSQALADQSELETRIMALEKQVEHLQKQLSTILAELAESQRLPVYQSLKLTNARVVGGPHSVGDDVLLSYSLHNMTREDIDVPLDSSFSRPMRIVGTRQHWIERDGEDKNIPGLPARTARQGAKYAVGGTIIPAKATIGGGDAIKLQQRLKTVGYPPGKYTVYIEYLKTRGGVLQTAHVEFELSKKEDE
jgi:hypothetical protein